jgi:hypothetical protein
LSPRRSTLTGGRPPTGSGGATCGRSHEAAPMAPWNFSAEGM